MQKHTLTVEAIITTQAPLSITMPVAEGGRANGYNNFPLMARGLDAEGQVQQTAYLPASTVRGFLRRACGLAAMAQRGEGKTTLQQAYSDILGQSKDIKEEVDLQQLAALREADPILDLFGSWSVKSRLLVSNFVPKVNILPQAVTGTRKDLEDTEGVLEGLTESDRHAYTHRSETNSQRAAIEANATKLKRELNKAKKDGKPAAELKDLETALHICESQVAALKAQMGDMANSSRTITTFYAFPADIPLHGRMVIEQAKERDLVLLLQGLDALSRRPLLGAQVARGCGEVAGDFTIKRDGIIIQTVHIGGWEPARVENFSG